jgi:hypothetical protein
MGLREGGPMARKAAPNGSRDGPGLWQTLIQFFTSVTGMITAFVTLLGTVLAIAASQQGDSGSSSSQPRSVTPPTTVRPSDSSSPPQRTADSPSNAVQDMNNVCNKLAADSDPSAAGPYAALITAAQSLRQLDVPNNARDSVTRAADELDEAALYVNHGANATPLVTTAVNRLAALGASECEA